MTDLAATAESVLDSNWIGASTKPSGHLYPHQWSWDSAFIAIGNARHGHTDRAVTELRTLFAAQWSTGMVPHMVFDQGATGYFPSAELWGTAPITAMPDGVLTSGMCQPPAHALAVREVAASLDPDGRRSFLAEMVEPLRAWHDYLHRTRAVGSNLIELWHPRLDPDPAAIPAYRRVDTDVADAAERPTREHYDRYVFLLEQLRRVEYQPPDPARMPFRICDVLFNALLADADAELAEIVVEVGAAGENGLRERSKALTSAIDAEMWCDELGVYVDIDRTTGDQICLPVAGGLTPVLLELPAERIGAVVRAVRDTFAVTDPETSARVIPTVPVDHVAFEADRYWRGPAWVNIMWLLVRGLRRAGESMLADDIRAGVLTLVDRSGCAEYYNPLNGEPRGASDFSWTAALTLDLLQQPGERGD